MTEPTPEQLAAGEPKGLSPVLCARLRGETPEELSADADAFLAEFAPPAPPAPPAFLVGGPRGVDVGNGAAPGTPAYGAALYRAKHGLDDEGNRPERRPLKSDGRNPFAERNYTVGGDN